MTLQTVCPACHSDLNRIAESDGADRDAQPDDFAICCNCAAVLVFTATMSLRPPTCDDVQRLDPEDCLMIESIRQRTLASITQRTMRQAILN